MYYFLNIKSDNVIPLMHNVPKWSDKLQNLAASGTRFLNCV